MANKYNTRIKRLVAEIKVDIALKELVRRFKRAKVRSDLDSILKVCDKLIEEGNWAIGSIVGIMFLNQKKMWYDPVTAQKYLEPAAEAGETNAQWHLGMIYYLGLAGGELDPVMGHYWIKKSADAGNQLALRFFEERDKEYW